MGILQGWKPPGVEPKFPDKLVFQDQAVEIPQVLCDMRYATHCGFPGTTRCG
jgi:hypothetical protein